MTTLSITLRDEDQRFIEAAVKSGRYVSESEAIADALAELRAREEVRNARIADLKAKVQIGLDQLDRGEGEEWSSADIKAEGRAALAARRSAV